MKYIARALVPKSSGLQPATPFTSPLVRMDQRWHLSGFAEQSALAVHGADAFPDDDGFVTVEEGLVTNGKASAVRPAAALSPEYPTAVQPAAQPTQLRLAADTRTVARAMHTSSTAPTVSTSAIDASEPATALPSAATTLAAVSHSEFEQTRSRFRDSESAAPETLMPTAVAAFVRVSRPALVATAPRETRPASAFTPRQVDMLAQVGAWLGGHGRQRLMPSLPASTGSESIGIASRWVGSPERTSFAPPVVEHTTLEIGNIEIEILPSPVVPAPKRASADPWGARAERGHTPFGGRQF